MVTYNVADGRSVHNTFLLDHQLFFEDANYNPNIGPLTIQLSAGPTLGTLAVVNRFDFIYTPPTNVGGQDGFAWQLSQNGVALGGVQQLNFNLPPPRDPGPNPIAIIEPLGTALADIQFLDFAVSAANSDKTLFLSDPDGSAPVGTTIEIGVTVSNYVNPTGVQPTGTVNFNVTTATGAIYQLGSAAVGPDGAAIIDVDSQILAKPGTVVTANYSGDAFFAGKGKADGNRHANALINDVTVPDNPTIAANAQNLTVVVVAGNDYAEQLRWKNSARSKYGTDAVILTKIHSLNDLGNTMSTLPNESVTKLIVGAHGNQFGAYFDPAASSNFTAFNLNEAVNTVPKNKIKAALKQGFDSRIEFQSCQAAFLDDGKNNMKSVALTLGVVVWGADKCIGGWDDGWGGLNLKGISWWSSSPVNDGIPAVKRN